ncbi:predicted protein [Naegleria gruberi]|uniref:Predicted protein n=1 Tax=Naegleria gruberi TaxID=5762 RepID=D2UZQ0_NAEGR|nr:uncharacterized protein NAEGRDRAFT_62019 [Naegleria gruberi]EFC49974.1 predicted protein [Naegleria gruberi]|eukprot:XP_002682718.1 predicted protein [Naegleria gruberi strain NEG-M]
MYSTTNSEEFSNKFQRSLDGPNNHNIFPRQSPSNHNTDPNLMRTTQLFHSTINSKSVTLHKGTGGGFQTNNLPFRPTDNEIPVQPVTRWRDRLIDPNCHPSDLSMSQSAFNKKASLYKEKEHADVLVETLKKSAGYQSKVEDDPLLSSHPTGYKSNFKSKNIVSGQDYPDHVDLPTRQHVSEMKQNYTFGDPYQFNSFMDTIKSSNVEY